MWICEIKVLVGLLYFRGFLFFDIYVMCDFNVIVGLLGVSVDIKYFFIGRSRSVGRN